MRRSTVVVRIESIRQVCINVYGEGCSFGGLRIFLKNTQKITEGTEKDSSATPRTENVVSRTQHQGAVARILRRIWRHRRIGESRCSVSDGMDKATTSPAGC